MVRWMGELETETSRDPGIRPQYVAAMTALASTPEPPYYAVIFSTTTTQDNDGYAEAAARMVELATRMPGFLGIDSAREHGFGITVSYWESEDAIANWKTDAEHTVVRETGRERWYEAYELRVARVERAYGFRSD